MKELYIDGSTTNICVVCPDGQEIVREAIPGAKVKSNQGEYHALITCLQHSLGKGYDDLIIYSDSQLLVRQLSFDLHGKPVYKTKDPILRELNKKCLALLKQFTKVQLRWIPREENKAGIILEGLKCSQ